MSSTQVGIKNPPPGRDAIHIAVIPVILGSTGEKSGTYYAAGHKVRLLSGTSNTVIPADYGQSDGIIDPFIQETLSAGDMVYLWLHPNTITGLKHHWEHPKFDAQTKEMSDAELWLRQFADRWGIEYDEMIRAAVNPYNEKAWDNYITAFGRDLHSASDLGEEYYTFWDYLETMTGHKFDSAHKEKVQWSCSC